jgi:CARDB
MPYDESENQAGSDNAAEQAAAFVLADNPGLLVNVDDDDNDAGHVILHSDSGTKVSFTVFNVGSASGSCTVSLQVDGNWVKDWTSSDLQPNGSESTEVRGLGRYPKGYHDFVAYVNPSAGHHDYLSNNVDMLDP